MGPAFLVNAFITMPVKTVALPLDEGSREPRPADGIKPGKT